MADFTARFIRKKSVQLALGLLVVCVGLIIWQINRPVGAENLLDDPSFNDATMANWRVASQGSGVASVAGKMLTLDIPDSTTGSWVGVGQQQPIAPLQNYAVTFDYQLLAPAASPSRMVLRVNQFGQDGMLLNTEEVSNIEPLRLTNVPVTFRHQFSTRFDSRSVEVGVGLLGQNSTSVQIRNVNLAIAPTRSGQIIASPVALVASGVAILALLTILGQAGWLARREIIGVLNGLVASQFFGLKDVTLIFFGFWAIVAVSNFLVKHVICDQIISFDCPLYWPVSMVSLRWPSGTQIFTAAGVLALFLLFIRFVPRHNFGPAAVVVAGFMTIVGSTLIQGGYNGFVWPIIEDRADRGTQYYHDATDFESVADILANFEARQEELHNHSKTHPPGPQIMMLTLSQIFSDISLISLTIAVVSITLSGIFFIKILQSEVSRDTALFVSFLFLLIPAIQIYYLASIDAWVSSFLIGFLFFYRHKRLAVSIPGSILFFFLASLLTFGAMFALPIVFGVDVLRRRIIKPLIIALGVASVYAVLYVGFGFNYLNAFMTASRIESIEFSKGFLLFVDPVSYFFTRIEGILEIFLFFGPFLTLLMIRSIRRYGYANSVLMQYNLLALLTFAGLFVMAVFRTGETARIGMFIYPYLMFPVGMLFKHKEPSIQEQNTLLLLVFSQTILMQLFGFYLW